MNCGTGGSCTEPPTTAECKLIAGALRVSIKDQYWRNLVEPDGIEIARDPGATTCMRGRRSTTS